MHHQRNRKHGNPYTNNALRHGNIPVANTVEYRCYHRIKSCILNQNNTKYYIYGGRGIKMCDRWLYGENNKTGFTCFMEDMGPKPDSLFSIERLDVNGNYEPSNCIWASSVVQGRNKRTPKNNTSGHKGVYWLKADNIWVAKIGMNYKEVVIGRFKDRQEAINARIEAENKYWS